MITLPRFDGKASCREIGGDEWFPETGAEGQEVTRQARKVCARCEIQQACLQWALDNDEAGIWGGLSERQRQRLIANRRRAVSA